MNTIGWILAIAGAIGLIASIAGIIHTAFAPSVQDAMAASATELYLHDTYYIIRHPYSVWPLLLCSTLCLAIGIIGYMHTEHFVRRMIHLEEINRDTDSPLNPP